MAKKTNPARFLAEAGIAQATVAAWFDVEPSTISRKLARERRWTEDEIKVLLACATAHLRRRRPVTFEEMFGAS